MKSILCSILLLFFSGSTYAQNDCIDAMAVCYDTFGIVNYLGGPGVQELNSGNVCQGKEENSIWFRFTIESPGTLDFYIFPLDTKAVDYDFWLFGPATSCSNLGSAIRCSTTERRASLGGSENITGISRFETDLFENPGEGNGFVSPVNVQAGQTYYLAVNQDKVSERFQLILTGTAKLKENPPYTRMHHDYFFIEKCDDDGVNDIATYFNLMEFENIISTTERINISYFKSSNDAWLNHNVITNPGHYLSLPMLDGIYVRIEHPITGCVWIDRMSLVITNTVAAGTPGDLFLCDTNGNGTQTFDLSVNNSLIQNGTALPVSYHLTEQDAKTGNNALPNLYQNTTRSQTIWARLSGTGTCYMYDVTSFTLNVPEIPKIEYTLNIRDFSGDDTSVEVIITEPEKYVYAVDNDSFSPSINFNGLTEGPHIFYIKPLDECGVIESRNFFILNYPKFFTPNNDGENDLWRIAYLTQRPGSYVIIFDRYGKLLTSFGHRSAGWNGTLKGKSLPADDYWFILHLDTGQVVKGHFALLR
ncbi:T9SS type B sorting domain-containing protein [Flavobacterium psychrotrophum]|uniref:T9SS type B sorting domain-containing protein n=1 Tax=Flavobacterium psychrotrophum TaxID=2294119 RepID=UPI000E320333|nr:T9SS type B sorting domain-containing protein [Flavobacterium psychrotrophum]